MSTIGVLFFGLTACNGGQNVVEEKAKVEVKKSITKEKVTQSDVVLFQEKYSGDIQKQCCPQEVYLNIKSDRVTGELIIWHLYDGEGLKDVAMESIKLRGNVIAETLMLEQKVSEWGADLSHDPGWEPKSMWTLEGDTLTNSNTKAQFHRKDLVESIRDMYLKQ